MKKSTFYASNRSLSKTHFQIGTLNVSDSIHLNDSLLVYRPHRWKASSSVRDTSSFASSSELRSSKQVSNWASRWRRMSRAEVDWDAMEDILSERTRGKSNVSDIFCYSSTTTDNLSPGLCKPRVHLKWVDLFFDSLSYWLFFLSFRCPRNSIHPRAGLGLADAESTFCSSKA